MEELWKNAVYDGVTYEGYKVSNLGRVKSLNYRNTGKEGVLRATETKIGYLQVTLYKDGKGERFYIHRLVAESFIPNPENKPEVNHIDEDKTNNSIENLKWVWHKDNINHGTRNERVSKANTNGKLSKPVLQFTLDGEFIREWPSINECGRNGFVINGVYRCCRGKKPQYKGFKWEYKKEVV